MTSGGVARTSWSLLVIQVHGSKIAPSEERVADWKILVDLWRNEHSLRDELSHRLVSTKTDDEPTSFTSVGSEAGSPESPKVCKTRTVSCCLQAARSTRQP